jgi:hypothetical protein
MEKKQDFITKICMASSFIIDGKTEKRYLSGARSFGDTVPDEEGKEARTYYEGLSKLFTDQEIKAMATLLNNLNPEFEKEIFEEYDL